MRAPLFLATAIALGCGGKSGDGQAEERPDAWPGIDGCSPGLAFDDISDQSPDFAVNPFGGEAGWDHVDKYGPGIALADLDGDGALDIVHSRSERNVPALRTPIVYRGLGDGTFEEAARPAWRTEDNGTVPLLFDYDGDDDLDLLIGIAGANARLDRNDGDFAFVDVTEEAGLANSGDFVYAAAAGDVDGDGWLDLYLGQWRADLPEHGAGQAPNALFMGSAEGFRVSPHNLECAGSATLGLGMADLDNDGDLDIYVANDFFEDCLYENLGDAGFRDVASEAGVATDAMHAMGVAFGDFNDDAQLDILVTDTEQLDSSLGNAAFLSKPGEALRYRGAARELGLDGLSTLQADWLVCWGVGVEDFDLDGYADVHMATHIERDEIFLHNQADAYRPAWNLINGIEGSDARATAYGDIDGDGDIDIVQGVRGGGVQVLRNTAEPEAFGLRVEIAPLRWAVGATVWVESSGRTQVRVIQAGTSYMASSPPSATFGLCGASSADRVRVRFADGTEHEATAVEAGVFTVRHDEL